MEGLVVSVLMNQFSSFFRGDLAVCHDLDGVARHHVEQGEHQQGNGKDEDDTYAQFFE